MARIRSIKPEFFTSETLAEVSRSARLTFIGLWTYVDDNGVGQDNARLIVAALDPLDEDPLEALRRTREDLDALAKARVIVRYEDAGKALLFVAAWDEHQRVSHPGKPRYGRPIESLTCTDERESERPSEPSGDLPETLPSPPEILVPEQGAGSREQGAGRGSAEPRATRIPDDFAIDDGLRAWAKAKALDVDLETETERFKRHWEAKGGKDARKTDWRRAWMNWIDSPYAKPRAQRAMPQQETAAFWRNTLGDD